MWDEVPRLSYFTLQVEAEYSEEGESKDCISSQIVRTDQTFTLSEEEQISCLGQFSRTHTSYHDSILALLLPAMLKVDQVVVDMDLAYISKICYDTCYLKQMIQRASRLERLLRHCPHRYYQGTG